MLTDAALRAFKPRPKPYKVTDRDGMYAHVAPSGAITFRLDYRLHGRRETLHLGRYGPSGLSLGLAREKCIDARRILTEGRSPAQEKQREKRWTCFGKVESSLDMKGELDDEATTVYERV